MLGLDADGGVRASKLAQREWEGQAAQVSPRMQITLQANVPVQLAIQRHHHSQTFTL